MKKTYDIAFTKVIYRSGWGWFKLTGDCRSIPMFFRTNTKKATLKLRDKKARQLRKQGFSVRVFNA